MVAVKDDYPYTAGNTAAFLTLCACDVLLLGFCSKRLYSHVRAKEKYAPLLWFYIVLVVFLCFRVCFYLDPLIRYNPGLYQALYVLPTILIVSAASLISYIWTEIAGQMYGCPALPFYFSKAAIRKLLLVANFVAYGLFISTFCVLIVKEGDKSPRPMRYTRIEECCLCFIMGGWQLFIGFKVEAVFRSLLSKRPKRVFFR
jgi:hypothetical protein